jgi:diadenosine tetraphosphatase ApaH/serine/threonine PP2A family protein phosphatase
LLALLYDVHGNLTALDAVIADARAAGVEGFVLGGDYAMVGAQPLETVSRLKELEAEWIRGNTERWVADKAEQPDDPFIAAVCNYARAQLGADEAERLNSLRETLRNRQTLFCHASPRSDMETFSPDPVPGEEELLAGAGEPMIVFGHSHLQFTRETAGRVLVNPGSVGLPLDGDPRAAYALWDGGRSFDLRRVEYDRDGYLDQVRTRMSPALGPHVDTVIRRIERAAP